MKVKVEKVAIGLYDYDSIFVKIEGKDTEIVFNKSEKVSQYEGKEIELVDDKGVYKIKPVFTKKND
jgi:hypothetical protein